RKLDLANARNQADQLCYQVEKSLEDHKDKLSEADKEPMQRAVTKLREVAGGEDLEGINSAIKDLEQAQQAWSKVLYEKAAAEGETEAPAGDAAAPDADDDAIDAEFEVKKD
ncbi:MAG: Hsp70 family protein, partial [Planctomycetota bacterium]|nr:Hsp70 family protein [Planctomycetota bacterium]